MISLSGAFLNLIQEVDSSLSFAWLWSTSKTGCDDSQLCVNQIVHYSIILKELLLQLFLTIYMFYNRFLEDNFVVHQSHHFFCNFSILHNSFYFSNVTIMIIILIFFGLYFTMLSFIFLGYYKHMAVQPSKPNQSDFVFIFILPRAFIVRELN